MNLTLEFALLEDMSIGELRERYAELWGETTRSRHRRYLVRRIAWQLQAQAEGGLSERARKRADELADPAYARVTPPKNSAVPTKRRAQPTDARIPAPGSMISRKYKGRIIHVLVTPEGFEYENEKFASLSAVAKAITGSHMNGYRFFKLKGRK